MDNKGKVKKGMIGLSKYYLGIDSQKEDIVSKRRDVCMKCDRMVINKNRDLKSKFRYKCGVCGCYVIPKTKLKSEKCPINRW